MPHGIAGWPRPLCAQPDRHDADHWQEIRSTLGSNVADLLSNRLTVRQVMTTATPLASPNTSVRALKSMLAARPLQNVAICDHAGHLLGIVSDLDLRRRGTCAADVMTREPYTAPPGARLDAAVTLMLDNHIGCLPIVDKGQLCGMLTAGDLTVALDCVLQAIRELTVAKTGLSSDTQTFQIQETRRFPPIPAGLVEPPDTMSSSAAT